MEEKDFPPNYNLKLGGEAGSPAQTGLSSSGSRNGPNGIRGARSATSRNALLISTETAPWSGPQPPGRRNRQVSPCPSGQHGAQGDPCITHRPRKARRTPCGRMSVTGAGGRHQKEHVKLADL